MRANSSQSQPLGLAQAGAAATAHHRVLDEFEPDAILHCVDREFSVPLDWTAPGGEQIELFVRDVVSRKNKAKRGELPVLIYLQGGPGFQCSRPVSDGGWMRHALKTHRVIMMDMRGTGRSHPLTPETLLERFASDAGSMAEHMTHYRADSIVADCEAIRVALLGKDKKISLLGQSFGGFTSVHYLCVAPKSLDKVLLTGGLPPFNRPASDVYRACYNKLLERNTRYYKKFPNDVQVVREIVQHLIDMEAAGTPVKLAAGGYLTARRFLTLGLSGLGSGGGFDTLHYMFEGAMRTTVDGKRVPTMDFLEKAADASRFESNPIYALLHEACYAQVSTGATNWAASRVLQQEFAEAFDPERALATPGKGVNFVAEQVFPWFFDGDYGRLGAGPIKECAEILAAKKDWPMLYSEEALRAADVPVAAAVYYDDLYVVRQFSEECAALLPNAKIWVTNEYQHSGIRDGGESVLARLFEMVDNEVNIPS